VYWSSARSFVDSVFGLRTRYQRMDKDPEGITFFKVLTVSLALEVDNNHPETSDDRDRVFSLLPLAVDANDFVGFPDYSWSCEKVYTELALRFLKQGEIDILAFSQFTTRRLTLPSWVPDWSDHIRVPCSLFPFHSYFKAGTKRSDQVIARIDDNKIGMKGVAVDTIQEKSTVTWDPDWSERYFSELDARAYVESIKGFCHKSPKVMTGEENITTARIAVGDECGWDNLGGNWQDNYLAGLKQLLEGFNSGNDVISKEHHDLRDIRYNTWYMHMRRIHSRHTYISSTGYVGLAPLHIEVGDELVIFLGSKTPYVIRTNKDGTHTLIGEAYVHGIMYGELLENDQVEVRDYILT
jgi:hypothetical protein